jgi:acetyl-CoA synthetase
VPCAAPEDTPPWPYKRIRRLEFAELPKTISGKIRRVQLRALEKDRRATGPRGDQEYWLDDFESA